MLMDVNMRVVLSISLIFLILEWTQAAGVIKTPPKKCGPYEVYSECGNNICQNTCANPKKSYVCKGTCTSGCICLDGYLRNSKGECVLPKQCDNCKENEEFSKCDNHGCQNTCSEPDLIARCTYAPGCYPGCICKKEYLRNNQGICVPECECVPIPQCTGENEEYSECGNNGCQNTCANPTIAMVCKASCKSGCICSEGFLRNSKGICVEPKKCDTCKANQVFSKCENHGCRNTCAEPELMSVCDPIPGCFPGCICIEGYLKNDKGECVAPKDCVSKPQCIGIHEEYSECGNNGCQNTCAKPTISMVCKARCMPGCICSTGFLRNSKGVCVEPKKCDDNKSCSGDHEEYSECGNDSCQKTCENYSKHYACRPSCFPGCICQRGFIRNHKGVCVNPKNCENDVCPLKNETYFDCVEPCRETCATRGKNIRCNSLLCTGGCDCKEGLYRNSEGKCVTLDECDTECQENEELIKCANPCPPETCETINIAFRCAAVDPSTCKDQCKCILNHKRDKNGRCVHISECPPKLECRKNEVYDACPEPCHDDTCSKVDSIGCDSGPPESVNVCHPKCSCIDGYLRNNSRICVPAKQCAQCSKNEFWDCGSACDTTCATLEQVCPIINKKCNEKCYCRRGFARNDRDECIPTEQCPQFCKKVCPPNQQFVACPLYCPPEKTCDDHINKTVYECKTYPDRLPCLARCECKPGFVRRAKDGDCITLDQCCQDPNAEMVNCPYPCGGGTCEQPEIPVCKKGCISKGCRCKKGYVKDKSGKCILLSECPPKLTCKANEVINKCPAPCPPERTCQQHIGGYEYDCAPPPEDWPCVPRCNCANGFVRNSKGVCVPPESCCDDPNAEIVDCPDPCPMTCSNMDQHAGIQCGRPCDLRGCACKYGYVKDSNGKCIPIEKCPPKECKANEKWVPCPAYCSFDETCEMLLGGFRPDCARPPKNPPCRPRCMCQDGYVRTNGSCVSTTTCCTEPNTQLEKCPTACEDTCAENFTDACLMDNCVFKICKCKPHYKRHKNKCIPLSECPKKCPGDNEEYQDCGSPCVKNCENMNKNEPCIEKCVKGCFCKTGYVRHNDKCIKPDKCPVCKEANTEYKYCGSACEPTCENKNQKGIACPTVCVSGCFCIKGFLLKNGKCVKPEDCKCGANEVWTQTRPDCPDTCANYKSKVGRCKTSKPGCACQPGYVLECKGGKCIKFSDCDK